MLSFFKTNRWYHVVSFVNAFGEREVYINGKVQSTQDYNKLCGETTRDGIWIKLG